MTRPQRFELIAAAFAAATLLALGSCVTREPSTAPQFNTARAARVVVPYIEARPEGVAPPSAARMCLLGTATCSEMFPQPARPCLLATERCPPDAKLERIETHPLVQPR
jgi:hypothetical protein